ADDLADEVLDLEVGAQRRVDHGDADGHVQVVAVAAEHRVRLGVHLDVEVAGRAAARADLAVAGHADAHAVGNVGGNVDGQVAARLHAAVAGAVRARVGDDLAGALASGAGARSHDVAQEGTLHLLDLTGAVAILAHVRLGLRLGAGALADVTEDGGVDGDRLAHAGEALVQAEGDAQQRVGAGLHAGAALAGAAATAEERLEHVAQAAATETATETAGAAARVHRVAAHV